MSKKEKNDLKIFGLIWAGIFMFIGIAPLLKGNEIKSWSVVISLAFITIGFLKPKVLQPFYVIWTKVGEFIGKFISKIMLFILYYFFFTPIAFILRLLGKDLLNKKLDKTQSSYWIIREKQPESMKHQF